MAIYFEQKNIQKTTLISPGKKNGNQIDHILIKAKHNRVVTAARSYREAGANSGHKMEPDSNLGHHLMKAIRNPEYATTWES